MKHKLSFLAMLAAGASALAPICAALADEGAAA